MSHEIRTPINAIMGMNELILRESEEASTIEYAQNIAQASESLLGIINDILDLSKNRIRENGSGSCKLQPQDIDH